MTRTLWIVTLLVFGLFAGEIPAFADESCGSEGLTCGGEEHCCQHTVAVFMGDSGAAGPSYMEGKCVPKAQRCSDYWCGNRHCSGGLFGTPSVCCVNNTPGLTTEYRCAYSELNCPGNTQQLTIRDHTPQRG